MALNPMRSETELISVSLILAKHLWLKDEACATILGCARQIKVYHDLLYLFELKWFFLTGTLKECAYLNGMEFDCDGYT